MCHPNRGGTFWPCGLTSDSHRIRAGFQPAPEPPNKPEPSCQAQERSPPTPDIARKPFPTHRWRLFR